MNIISIKNVKEVPCFVGIMSDAIKEDAMLKILDYTLVRTMLKMIMLINHLGKWKDLK